MQPRPNLTSAERLEIALLRRKGYSCRGIAQVLGRSPNTVSRELRVNAVAGSYDPKKAQAKSRVRKRLRRFQWRKIREDTRLRDYVIAKLRLHWNPDEIAGAMRQEKQPFYASKTCIYAWLRSVDGIPYCRHLYSGRWRRKPHRKKTPRVMIPDRTPIAQRFRGADTRSRAGHWEEDTVVSSRSGTGALAVLTERKSRYVAAQVIPSLSPQVHARAVRGLMKGKKVLSCTFDNGLENKLHASLGVPTFFCDPYASWQKGSVENANRMLRRYFPKGTDFASVSQADVNRAVSLMNGKPRKILGYRSALAEAFRLGIRLPYTHQETKTPREAGVLIEG